LAKLPRTDPTPGTLPGVVVFGLLICLFATVVRADCVPTAALEPARVARIVDGDTLALADGRSVRLIGINAPEAGRGSRPGEPLARQARAALQQLLPPGSAVYLQAGDEPRDNHGRTLAHAFRSRTGDSAEAALIERGLAQQIVVPPNLALAACLFAAEREARAARHGIWGEDYFRPRAARALTAADAGYRRVRLRVTDVKADRHGWWLDTDGPLTLRVLRADARRFPSGPQAWAGRELVVRGWIKNRSGDPRVQRRGYAPLLLPVRHPYMVESGLL
jgi:endonuclease YncB( thermonuclease family)